MKKFNFYHFILAEKERCLGLLLDKIFQMKKRSLVLCNDESHKKKLDSSLWTFSNDYFIPHGVDDDKFVEDQPILLTCKSVNLNNAEILCLMHDSKYSILESTEKLKKDESFYGTFSTIVYFYDGELDDVEKNKIALSEINKTGEFDVKYNLKMGEVWKILTN